jgi:hypothetical protein
MSSKHCEKLTTTVALILECVEHFNFINCPDLNENQIDCKETLKFANETRKCGHFVNETFIPYSHSFYY